LPFKLLNRLNSMPVRREQMLWTIFAILIVLWLLGWGFHVAGSLIHLLLVVALVVAVVSLLTGRRAV
jgi:DMSO reductase anchor subunit